MEFSKDLLLETHEKIKPFINKTPVLQFDFINDLCDCKVYFKCENFQKTGSFKIRAASNALKSLSKKSKEKGVITHSSGNFAQGLACASNLQNINAYIVMPENAPRIKKNSVLKYDVNLIECKSTLEAREKTTSKILLENDLHFIHPSNDIDVILGNSTIGTELLKEFPDLDYILAPIGGGGLISGIAIASDVFSNKCEVIGVEPKEVDDAYRSLQSGKIEYNSSTKTIADGLRTNLGDINFPIIKKLIRKIICVKENEIINTMKIFIEKLDLVIEPSSAVALAGLIAKKEIYRNKKVGVVISGGNVDLNELAF
ncbi:MAG: pyridoxal-phosphate dependent enzyme [Flavobacteriaceae bacterium]|jgi:threonine dehydratase|nr:pyridoxal-phosphate dependent enzyme [Flavobacteriaceae bacterium]MBT4113525.1 pyridoxal-phosphate dependent enzyme [Flavobacteriaceae bacterium]MBT4613709.1 pyridoxal-phosphate dependent enzyme [Flavobacteriaceae bacterium]MBT5246043.1 pyridoxal-phosphate dependent enzyme [Flavobacteriaceae bacterium]MBT5650690.1 pyridoxal-phosphate dependent enzyme [Flavobacteriaceae bacterium]|tara:strand:+ start:669 stop:1610 length:942 start_codon:yes stop_codon:yes gene_type:complete